MNHSKSHPTSRASRAYIHCAARGRTLAYVLALGTLGVISPAQAVTPACGDVITGDAVLTGSLTCDDSFSPSLTILGPANVVARGFTLTCSVFGSGGVDIDGERVNLVGGRMTGCTRVFINGSRHKIVNMTVEGAGRGFGVSCTNSLLVGNAALNNEAEGFEVFDDGQ